MEIQPGDWASVQARFWAWLLDLALGIAVIWPLLSGDFLEARFAIEGVALYFSLQSYWLAMRGQSVGKRAVGICVVDARSGSNPGFVRTVLLREGLSAVLGLVPFYKLVDPLFGLGQERRCLHDLMAGTRVIKSEGRSAPASSRSFWAYLGLGLIFLGSFVGPLMPTGAATLYFFMTKDPAAGADYFGKQVVSHPGDPKLLFIKGMFESQAGQKDAALADLGAALAAHPKDADARMERGAIYLDRRQYALALADYLAAADATPKDPAVWANIGLVKLDLGDKKAALAYFDQALTLDPNDETIKAQRQAVVKLLGAKSGA